MMQENIHVEVIDLFIDVFCSRLGRDVEEEKKVLQGLCQDMSSYSRKLAWLDTHVNDSLQHFSVRNGTIAMLSYSHSSRDCCIRVP